VIAVVEPDARRADELTGADDGGVTRHDHQIALPSRLDPENAEAVLSIVVGDPLEHPGERLRRCSRSRRRRDDTMYPHANIGASPCHEFRASPLGILKQSLQI
jgi:hypothetical protein